MKPGEPDLSLLRQRELIAAEFIPDYAVFTLDLAGLVSSWSPGAERMLGFSAENAMGQRFFDLLPPIGAKPDASKFLQQALAEGLALQETMYRRHGDDTFPGTCTLALMQGADERPSGFVVVLRDNTEREASKASLRQAKRNAEIASEMRDLFLSKVSHELRTPLSAILLWLSLIEDPSAVDRAQLAEALTSIKQSAEEQHQLIETLVDTYRVIAGKFTLNRQESDLAKIIDASVDRIQSAVAEKNLSVFKSIDPTVSPIQADPLRIAQMVDALLDNAVKFTPSGGAIRVSLQRTDEVLQMTFTDTGVGMSGEVLPHIFDRFSNLVDEPAKIHGLGLGLAVARQIAHHHRGRITATSDGPGQGSQFTVMLPTA